MFPGSGRPVEDHAQEVRPDLDPVQVVGRQFQHRDQLGRGLVLLAELGQQLAAPSPPAPRRATAATAPAPSVTTAGTASVITVRTGQPLSTATEIGRTPWTRNSPARCRLVRLVSNACHT